MSLPEASFIQFTPDLKICRILNGMWQVSGAHGPIVREAAIADMFQYLDSGFTTWDLADHYGPAEDFVGQFRRELRATRDAGSLSSVQAFTKWVPPPATMMRELVEDSITISLRRMDVDALDLLQFHWWDYDHPGYVDALTHLSQLQDEGKIKHLGLTNFDTEHLERVLDHGIRVVSNQVQFSLIDRRPEVRMIEVCRESNVKLLTYGTVCGGLLSERYLGQPEPRGNALNTASLGKYVRMVEAWGRGMPLILENEPDAKFREVAKIFIASFGRPSFVEDEGISGDTTGQVEAQVESGAQSDEILRILLRLPLSANDLVTSLGLQSKTGAFKRAVNGLLEKGLIEYTLPDKPTSRLQQYRLTEKGERSLKSEGRSLKRNGI